MSQPALADRTAMPNPAFPKTTLLRALKTGEPVAMYELTARLPEFRWRELFLTIRALNRQGAIRLHRQGYDFFVTSLPGPSPVATSAACSHAKRASPDGILEEDEVVEASASTNLLIYMGKILDFIFTPLFEYLSLPSQIAIPRYVRLNGRST